MVDTYPKMEIANLLWERCCGRVAHPELHIASEKISHICIYMTTHVLLTDGCSCRGS